MMKFTWTRTRIRSRARQIWSGCALRTHSRRTLNLASPRITHRITMRASLRNTRFMIDIPLSTLKRKEYLGRRSLKEWGIQYGEFDPEKDPDSNDLSEWTNLITEAL